MTVQEMLQKTIQAVALPALTTLERLQTGVSYNPLAEGYRTDPYPQYRALQTRDPFHRTRLADGWVLTRHEHVSAAARDGRFFTDERKHPLYEKRRAQLVKAGARGEEPQVPSMLRLDPPDHTRLRSLVSKAFTPRTVEQLRPRAEALVQELLDEVQAAGRMDVIKDLANPLPVVVIAELIGVPPEDREKLKRWSDDIVLAISGLQTIDGIRRSRAAGEEMRAYLEGVAEERRREPREDLISALLTAEEEGDRLSMDEVFSTCILLLVAGHETTTNLIGNGLLALLQHTDQMELLRNDSSLIENAVEELLRYDSPVQLTGRFVLEDMEMAGQSLKAGQQVILLLGAANRDPEKFSDPDRLDITRDNSSQHLSFSHGIHACLGAPLARLEGQVVFQALGERFPEMRLATDRLKWGEGLILRGLEELPVTF